MKNFRKIVACAMAMCTLASVSPIIASAEIASIVPVCEPDENNPSIIKIASETTKLMEISGEYTYCNLIFEAVVDTTSEEFIHFLSNAEPRYSSKLENSKVINIKVIGFDDNGNAVLSDGDFASLDGFDDNGNPIVNNNGSSIAEIAPLIGFAEGKVIIGSINSYLIRFDENNQPSIVNYEQLGNGTYKTIDVNTGEDILVKPTGDLTYDVIEKGDVTADTETDIRDITAFNQSIVKMNEIPDYLNSIADIDSDGEIGIKDLGLLKKFIVKTIDTL